MKSKLFAFAILLTLYAFKTNSQNTDSIIIRSIFSEALTHDDIYQNLKFLCKNIGGRICGSPQSIKAVMWTKDVMQKTGADTVYLQEHLVRNWKRGKKEVAYAITPSGKKIPMAVCALGGSIGTGSKGIKANIVEVKNFDELKKIGKENVKGKIVFFNRPADPTHYSTFPAYGGAANQRVYGAIYASFYGGVASVSRSLTLAHHNYPHTGIMHYEDTIQKIPAFAISTQSADYLSKLLKDSPDTKLYLKSSCFENPDTISYNVIAEIKGSTYPNDIILIGAHLDAWDNGEGAHDDGAGVVQIIEVIRIFKALQLKPKHTIRIVQYMDEEMAQRGARKYAEIVSMKNEKHIAAIETDRGGFTPQGFSYDADDNVTKKLNEWKPLLIDYGLWLFPKGYSGVDISFLKQNQVPLFALMTDSQRYFDYQHAATDVFEAVHKRELQLGAASIAALVYLIDKYGL